MLPNWLILTLFRMGGIKSPYPSPTSFAPVISINVKNNHQNFLMSSLNSFVTLSNFKAVLSASPKILNLNQKNHQKIDFSGQSLITLTL